MRKEIHRLNIEDLSAVLVRRGYHKDHNKPSWRKGRLHVMVKQKKTRTELHIHKDPRGHNKIPPATLPFEYTRHSGEDLAYELRSIMRNYKKR